MPIAESLFLKVDAIKRLLIGNLWIDIKPGSFKFADIIFHGDEKDQKDRLKPFGPMFIANTVAGETIAGPQQSIQAFIT